MTVSKLITEQKRALFDRITKSLIDKRINIESIDENRPWGGFFVIDPESTRPFINHFFSAAPTNQLHSPWHLSPKILVVQPNQRLSWQYHHRRAEIWTIAEGEVGVISSETNEPGEQRVFTSGDVIHVNQGMRHRIVGLNNWAIVAEIWQHTDPENPSDEEDIVRLQDDYGR